MSRRFFITGTGTGIGKTIVSAIVTQHFGAAYWKPVQAGYADGTDTGRVSDLLSDARCVIHPELYKLKMAASPHIAAREEGVLIEIDKVVAAVPDAEVLVIEGAGGLMVPLNSKYFVADLIAALGAKVILVSKNELGSINHSLLTAAVCKARGLDVAGWIFNGRYLDYEEEILAWTNLPRLGSVPHADVINKKFVSIQADRLNKIE